MLPPQTAHCSRPLRDVLALDAGGRLPVELAARGAEVLLVRGRHALMRRPPERLLDDAEVRALDRHQLLTRRLLSAVRRPAVAGPAVHQPPTVQLAAEDGLDARRRPLIAALRGVATVLAARVLHAFSVQRRGDLEVAHT
jgi:hypothetical protein